MKIAITGGIGSGKSLVAKFLINLGAAVISADDVYHDLLESNRFLVDKILTAFPECATKDGKVDKKILAKIIFKDAVRREQLNKITHPAIFTEMERLSRKMSGIIFFEIPLLAESGACSEFDEIWLVIAEKEIRIKRIMARDKIKRKFAIKKIEAQATDEVRMKKANRIILNNGDELETEKHVKEFYCEVSEAN